MVTVQPLQTDGAQKSALVSVLTPKEAAHILKVSTSYLAKARMSGDGPPFSKLAARFVIARRVVAVDEIAAAAIHQ